MNSSVGPIDRIPVVILTGFLGSGKTTLLARTLRQPEFDKTLVLVNELGEVGLDHHLLWTGGGAPMLLANGCVCCTVGDDLATSLEDLFWQRLRQQIPRFDRIVLETTGVADPRPVVAALVERPFVRERYRYGGTVTVVDAERGLDLLDANPEAVAQVALADRLVLSKTDLVDPAARVPLVARIGAINPLAQISEGSDPTTFSDLTADPRIFVGSLNTSARSLDHLGDVAVVALPLRADVDLEKLQEALKRLAAAAGRALLRAKGVILIDSHPIALQMVGEQLMMPQPLPEGVVVDAGLVVICRSFGAEAILAELADFVDQ